MDALSFGVVFALYNGFSAEAERIQQSMRDLEGEANAAFQNIERSMNEMALGAAALTAGGGILKGIFKASEVRAEFQAYETQFETLLGSADRAAKMMDKIKEDAAANPVFGTEGLTAANAAILATGRMTEDASRSMVNNLSNILAGVGRGDKELKNMAVNLQGIVGTGKVTVVDMKQFIGAGIPVFTILEKATGKTQAELEKTGVSAELLASAFEHASSKGGMFYGATERAANTTKGLKDALDDGIELTLERIGAAIEPVTRGFYTIAGSMMDMIKDFVSSPFGAMVMRLITALGVLLTILGAVLVVKGGLRFATFKLTSLLGAETAATLRAAMAQTTFGGGLKLVTAEIWKTLAPTFILVAQLLLVAAVGYAVWKMIDSGNEKLQILGTMLGVVGAIVASLFAPIYGVIALVVLLAMWLQKGFSIWTDGMNEAMKGKEGLDKYVEGLTTLEKTFAGVIGVISAVAEIWSSWNGETYELSEETAQKLDALGLTDFVHRLATHIAAFQEFFKGMWDSITTHASTFWNGYLKPLFNEIWTKGLKPLWDSIANSFMPIWNKLFGGDNSDPKGAWDWGKTIGNALSVVFSHLRQVLEFLSPIIIAVFQFVANYVIPAIAAWYETLFWVIGVLWDLAVVVAKVIGWVINMFATLIGWFWEKTAVFREIGLRLFTGLWNGLKEVWGAIKSWITSIVDWIVDKIAGAISGIANAMSSVGEFFGIGGNDGEGGGSAPKFGGNGAFPVFSPVTSKTPAFGKGFGGGGVNNFSSNPVINVTLDGDKIASSIQQRQEMAKARKNG